MTHAQLEELTQLRKQAIGVELMEKRKALKLTQYDVEEGTGLYRHQIRAIEKATANYSIESLIKYQQWLSWKEDIISKMDLESLN